MNFKKFDAEYISKNGNLKTLRKGSCCDVWLGSNQTISSGRTEIHYVATIGTRTVAVIHVFVEAQMVFVIA